MRSTKFLTIQWWPIFYNSFEDAVKGWLKYLSYFIFWLLRLQYFSRLFCVFTNTLQCVLPELILAYVYACMAPTLQIVWKSRTSAKPWSRKTVRANDKSNKQCNIISRSLIGSARSIAWQNYERCSSNSQETRVYHKSIGKLADDRDILPSFLRIDVGQLAEEHVEWESRYSGGEDFWRTLKPEVHGWIHLLCSSVHIIRIYLVVRLHIR